MTPWWLRPRPTPPCWWTVLPKVVSTATDAAGNTYYRLRDLAAALNGTGKQFNVLWNAGVEITTGAAYADPPL